MVTYAKDEMVGITDLGKSLGAYLDKVTSNTFNKIAILRKNKPEAVIVPIEEYEYMRNAADYFEDMEIEKIVKERMSGNPKMISEEELFSRLREAGKDV